MEEKSRYGKSSSQQNRAKNKLPAVHVLGLMILYHSDSDSDNHEHEMLVVW